MSSNMTAIGQGGCPAPFLQSDQFPTTGGHIDGRFCSAELGLNCCLPCPSTEWFYSERFDTITSSVDWINVGGLVCSVFLVTSFTFLPVEKTHRHYLSVCLATATFIMTLGFIIPLGARPNQCFNDITPNDMHTSSACSLSGAFLIIGGWSAVMWVFLRSLALHLQICWQLIIGKTFMWAALAAGWGIPAIGLTIAMVFSGLSFRFGSTCHINHKNSLAGLWVPLLVFAGATVIVQFSTFAYCIKYSKYNYTSPSISEVRKVIELQWRGIAIVLLIIGDVIFFAVVFVFMDDVETHIIRNPAEARDWITCLITQNGNKNNCLKEAEKLVVSEPTLTAVLLLLSLNGFWALIFLGRLSMFTGWWDILHTQVRPEHEFVSADAHVRNSSEPRCYEMLSKERGLNGMSISSK